MENLAHADSDFQAEVQMEHAEVNHDMEVPTVGMVFNSDEELRAFYKNYASNIGFEFRVRNSRKDSDGKLHYMSLSCARQGRRGSKIPTALRARPTKQAECDAKITASKGVDGRWCINKVVVDHNHVVSPTKSRMLRANKSLSLHVKRAIELHDCAGVRITKTFQTLVKESGGFENLPFGEREVRNYIHKQRRAIGKGGDAKALVDYFSKKKAENADFCYDIDLDEEFRVRNIFWADERSRAAYEYFGDVVSFDTTYLTNKYDMPFAAFVGVNHHGQSVLLGCGLLSAEDTESFVWLFQSWIRCMLCKAPDAIVTDQCRAMEKAIENVMPHTRHRWCLWHIMKKVPEKLKGYGEYHNIRRGLLEAVYETSGEQEFEDKWACFVRDYELQSNEWLGGLFERRHKWVPIYLKKDFWAGLSTTQRSESIHSFFDGYVN